MGMSTKIVKTVYQNLIINLSLFNIHHRLQNILSGVRKNQVKYFPSGQQLKINRQYNTIKRWFTTKLS